MFDIVELLLLGAVAGFTILLGLPVALLGISERAKGFLNALAVGILVFLIVDVFASAWDLTTAAVVSASRGLTSPGEAATYFFVMFAGLALGLLGLVYYERRYIGRPIGEIPRHKLATMIALGIGAHNLSEGLAIGQSYASNEIGLAIVLVVGFGAHNATEGFGITAPLVGMEPRPKVSFLVKILLIGGSPTFFGTILGSLFGSSTVAYILFLSLAGGALVYVTMMLFNAGRRRNSNELMMAGIFLGMCAGFMTDLIVTLGGA